MNQRGVDMLKRFSGRHESGIWLYIKSESHLWTVGFYKPDGKFEPESDHDSSEKAALRVHYLNGSGNYAAPAAAKEQP